MSRKNKKNSLQGMEHLRSELEPSSNIAFLEDNQIATNSIIKTELVQILIIMIILFATLFLVLWLDNNYNFLQNIAERIDNWI
ncbi:MAG: hypothetical protein Q8P20_06410 [bacterium]|nr:hypothetical protein [bacterium]